jgi:hypothetical protein
VLAEPSDAAHAARSAVTTKTRDVIAARVISGDRQSNVEAQAEFKEYVAGLRQGIVEPLVRKEMELRVQDCLRKARAQGRLRGEELLEEWLAAASEASSPSRPQAPPPPKAASILPRQPQESPEDLHGEALLEKLRAVKLAAQRSPS